MDGAPNIPGYSFNPHSIVSEGIDAIIGFGGAYAIGLIFGNRWGIFNQYGVPVLLADNVTSVEYQNTANLLSAPVEKGTFASYNKVQDPSTAVVQMTKGGGDVTARGLFITQLEALSRSTLLFHVLTPEYVHLNMAISGFGYKRTPTAGARIIIANISLKEVREVTVLYDNEDTENPEDQPVSDSGDVQALPVEESFLSSSVRYLGDLMNDIYNRTADAFEPLVEAVQGQ